MLQHSSIPIRQIQLCNGSWTGKTTMTEKIVDRFGGQAVLGLSQMTLKMCNEYRPTSNHILDSMEEEKQAAFFASIMTIEELGVPLMFGSEKYFAGPVVVDRSPLDYAVATQMNPDPNISEMGGRMFHVMDENNSPQVLKIIVPLLPTKLLEKVYWNENKSDSDKFKIRWFDDQTRIDDRGSWVSRTKLYMSDNRKVSLNWVKDQNFSKKSHQWYMDQPQPDLSEISDPSSFYRLWQRNAFHQLEKVQRLLADDIPTPPTDMAFMNRFKETYDYVLKG